MSSGSPLGGVRIRWLPIVLGLVAAGFVALRGCQEGPFGRNQIVGMNAEQEARLGAQAFQQVLQESDVVREGPAVEAVRKIGRRLAEAAERDDVLQAIGLARQRFEWEFRVVRSPQVNAFCLPGGKVVVYTGILPVAKSEAGLATVMGHEIGHALAHHGAERMAQQQLVQIGQMAAAGSIDGLDIQQQRQLFAVLGAGSKFGVLLPFSRKHESEADHIGLFLMAAAGYDPREAATFWERMDEKSGGKSPPEFASTHPGHETRVQNIRGWMDEALPFYQKNKGDGGSALPHDGADAPARRPSRAP